MGALLTLSVIVAVFGLALVILSVIPVTAPHIPNGLSAGITLLVLGVAIYVVVSLIGHPL